MPPVRVASLLALASLLLALPARAQGPAAELSSPGVHVTPTPALDADPNDRVDLDVPAPPGASGEVPDVRYPVPTPAGVAEAADDDEPSIRISSRITTRLRALDANLRALAQGGGANVVNAVLSMLTGGLAITLGALRDTPADPMSIYLYVYGGSSAVRGVLSLVLAPDASDAAITYQHMPMTTVTQVEERLEYGERELRSLADRALIARVLDASINMAAGVAVVPIYLANTNFTIVSPLDYFILIGAGVSIISGVITLASTSSEERRWSAYARLRDRLEEERIEERQDGDEGVARAPESRWRVALSPTPSGAFGGFTLAF